MKRHILVVEDSRIEAEVLYRVLQHDYEVTVAVTAEDALERLGDRDFSLVLTDVVMPGQTGYDLCQVIKSHPARRRIPVVLLTGLTGPLDIVRGLEAGADNYIAKPYEPEHLLTRIRHVLDNQRLAGAAAPTEPVRVQLQDLQLTITSEKAQILDVLLSSLEDASRTNRALQESRRELAAAHRELAAYAQAKTREAAISTERYRTLMQRAGDAIFILDRRGIVVEANARAEEVLGLPLEELTGRSFERLIPQEEVAIARDGLAHLLRVGHLQVVEQALIDSAGQRIVCEVTASLIAVGGERLVLAIFRDITDRRVAEARLRSRERQLADAQHIARVGSWDWDLTSDELDVSEAMFTIFGIEATTESLPGSCDFLRLVHPDDQARMQAAIDASVHGDAPYDIEFRIIRDDAREAFVHVRGETVREEGVAVRMIGTIQDVTDRKTTEARLEEGEQRYRSLFDYNPDATFSLDLTGRFTSANPACSSLSGYEPDSLLGTSFDPLIVPEHRGLARERFEAACRGRPQTYQIGLIHRDGRRLELSVTNTPIRVGGELVGVFGLAKDITERVRAQETLRAVVDASPVGIMLLSPEGRILSWSAAAERIFGWTAAEVLNRRPPFVPEDRQQEFQELCEQVLAGESLLGRELVRIGKDGSEIPISLCASPLRASDGTIEGIVSVVQDLSGRQAAEQALLESQRQLQHAQKMEAVGRLAGGIAHDFNNLLTAIKGSAQMLLLDTPAASPMREDLVDIDEAVDRATNLTRQLLTFSRKGVIEPRALDLRAIVADSEKMLRRMLREDVTLETELGDEPLCIEADPGQLEQVLMNLLVNARDAMPDGGRVSIQMRPVELKGPFGKDLAHLAPGPYVLLCVSDTGCGMSPEVQQCAFDPFFTTKPQGQGTGLGLSTVYGIVQQSGGFIQLHSRVGSGTTVRIFLPRLGGSPEGGPHTRAPAEFGQGTETLLLVEDEPYVRGVVQRALQRSGYRVLLAREGEEAYRIASDFEGAIDLLITDVVMPGMSGADLAAKARALRPELRVLFMSGYTDEVISQHGVLDPGVNFIQKPFSPHALVSRIREVLGAVAGV